MDIEKIYEFLIEEQGIKRSKLSPCCDLRNDLGIEGDYFSELIESFAEKHQVNMNYYRWYFHHGEEDWSIGALFFVPPYDQVKTIGISPQILLDAARSKKWPISYPKHQMTKGRPDITFNMVFLVSIVLVGGVVWLVKEIQYFMVSSQIAFSALDS
ncbi:DUF1493 family protein [Aliamphritea ceti]|uniref:DUF1493 family protein n=1 Tax=Aliamphritea ceti TaxID=1524258 RepID=UPI0021C32003|nr:DUF1493 family protein [Aliamphritea ceti]